MNNKTLPQLSDAEKMELIQHLQEEVQTLQRIYPSQYRLNLTNDVAVDEVIKNLPILVFVSDTNGKITEIQGQAIAHVIHEEQIANAVGQYVGKVFRQMPAIKVDSLQALQGEAIQNTVELGEAIFRAYYQPIHDGDTITGVVTVLTDIQQMTLREATYQDSETRLRAIFEQTQQFMCLLRSDGSIIEVNRVALEFAGLNRQEVLGKNLWNMAWWRGDDGTRLTSALQQCAQGETVEYETDMWGKRNQTVTIDLSLKPIINNEQKTTMILAEGHNVTQRKAAAAKEKELSDLKSQFITFTSHEFRNPLAVIASSTYLLRKQGANAPEEIREKYFNKIQNNVDYIATMLDDILLLGGLKASEMRYEPSNYPISQTTELLLQDYDQRFGLTHTFTLETYPADIYIHADSTLWEQAMNQLLKNAVIFSGKNGKVAVQMSLTDDMFTVRIADNGIGIPPSETSRIFESFVRGSNVGDYPGTGLGLAIVNDIINLHGGTIAVESEVGKTVFTIQIPQ